MESETDIDSPSPTPLDEINIMVFERKSLNILYLLNAVKYHVLAVEITLQPLAVSRPPWADDNYPTHCIHLPLK